MKASWSAWSDFWFASGNAFLIAAFRCFLALTLLVMYCIRALDFELFFSDRGVLDSETAKSFFSETMQPLLFLFPDSSMALVWLYALFLILLLLLALGLVGRWGTWSIYFLHVLFLQRNYSIVYGADSIATFWLLYLSFCRHNDHFNVLHFFEKFKKSISAMPVPDIFTSMGYRLIQVQLCVIYAFTGWEKLRGDRWWEGSALWYVMGNSQLVPLDLSFMLHVPWLVALMTFATLVFEIYFPFAVLAPYTRRLWLALGVAMHLGTALFMGLPFFSFVMLSTYLLFLNPETVKKSLKTLILKSRAQGL